MTNLAELIRSSGICMTLELKETVRRSFWGVTNTYISGGTVYKTGIIGRLKYLCLYTVKIKELDRLKLVVE
jgi:hypothetical protein